MLATEIINVKDFNWYTWVAEELRGYDTILELGAGFFNRLDIPDSASVRKIGIEIYKPYIDNARNKKDCIKILGDMRDYRRLTSNLWVGSKVAMFFDSLEHIDHASGIKLIEDLKQDFDKIIIMIPRGHCVLENDVTGFNNDEGQRHKSYWYDQDILGLGMTEILVDDTFHKNNHTNPDKGCYFAKWLRI